MLTRPRHPSGFVRKHPDTSITRWQAIVKYPDPDNPEKWKQQAKTVARKAEAQKSADDRLAGIGRTRITGHPSGNPCGSFSLGR